MIPNLLGVWFLNCINVLRKLFLTFLDIVKRAMVSSMDRIQKLENSILQILHDKNQGVNYPFYYFQDEVIQKRYYGVLLLRFH